MSTVDNWFTNMVKLNVDDTDKIALFDLDGSLADYEGQLLNDLLALRSPTEPELWVERNGIMNYGTLHQLEKEMPWIKARIDLIKSQPGWWRNLPMLVKGKRVFDMALTIGFNNKVLTKGPKRKPLAWAEKLEWSHQHLGEDTEVTITFDKSDVYGRVLYDDYPEYVYAWLKNRPRGLVIMPVPHYIQEHNHPRVVQYDGTNGDQVYRALSIAYNRQPHESLIL